MGKVKGKTPVILLRSLNVNRGGVTKASLKRANLFADKYESVIIITTLFQQRHKEIISNLRKRKELAPNIEVYNFFEDMRGKSYRKLFNRRVTHYIKEKGYIEFKVNTHPGESYRYYKDGNYKMYKRFLNGNLVFIDHMDESGRRFKREEFDERGFLIRERIMDIVNNKPRFDKYYDQSGKCILGIHVSPKSGKEGVVIDFSKNTSYDQLYSLQSKWIEDKLAKFDGTVLFTEFRGNLDEITYEIKHSKIRKVAVVHSSHLKEPYDEINQVRPAFHNLFKHNLYDRVVFLTNSQKTDVESVYGENEKYLVIPHSYNTHNIKPIRKQNTKNNKLAIMIVRYEKDKRVDEAINAFKYVVKEIPDAKLHIYGKGSLHLELTELIKKLGLENNVYLKGYTDKPWEKYQSAACSIITSRREGFGLVIVESMAVGTPVIAYDFKYGPKDIIEDGKNSYLVKNGDKKRLADKIITLMSEKKHLQEMSKEALNINNRFSEKDYADAWLRLLEELL